MYWAPEIARRGGIESTGPVYAALAILMPGRPVEVRLNDEVQIVARAKVNAAVQRGEPVTVANLDDVEAFEPLGVDPNAGWVAWLVMPDGRQYSQFDFVRNRGRSLRLIALARQYLKTAEDAVAAGRSGPAAENALAAAELAVTAQAYSFDVGDITTGGRRNSHSARKHWTKVQVGLGNTTADAHKTLVALGDLRAAARYGEGALSADADLNTLVISAGHLVADAATRIGPALRTQDPSFLAALSALPLKDPPSDGEGPVG